MRSLCELWLHETGHAKESFVFVRSSRVSGLCLGRRHASLEGCPLKFRVHGVWTQWPFEGVYLPYTILGLIQYEEYATNFMVH